MYYNVLDAGYMLSNFFSDDGKEGTVIKNNLGEKSFRVGEQVKVKFSEERVFDNGKKLRFYELA